MLESLGEKKLRPETDIEVIGSGGCDTSTQNWKENEELSQEADAVFLLKGGDNTAYGNGFVLDRIRFLVQKVEMKEEATGLPEESLADMTTL